MLVDRVDEKDRVVGTIQRADVFKKKAGFRVVHIFLFNNKRELLIPKIAAGNRHAGFLGSSVAGVVAAGETYDQTAKRKLLLELGLKNLKLKKIGKTSMKDEGCKKFVTLYEGSWGGARSLGVDKAQIERLDFLPTEKLIAQGDSAKQKFTPTFLHVLDFYINQK